MKPEEIDILDWTRIFIGEVPGSFYIEVVLRALFIYVLLVASMRIMGKRMAAQLDKIELAALVSLAAAIGVPIQAPDRGLLPALVIAIVVILVGKIIFSWSFRNHKFEKISQDNVSVLVRDSTLDLKAMKKTRITPERLFALLREESIVHLGAVDRVYSETTGQYTVIQREKPQPGLSIIPKWDAAFSEEFKQSSVLVCAQCGKKHDRISEPLPRSKCQNCKNEKWVAAIE